MAASPIIDEVERPATTQPPNRRTRLIALYGVLALIALVAGVVFGVTRGRSHTAALAAPTEQSVVATLPPGISTPTPLARAPTPTPALAPPTVAPPTAEPPVAAPPRQVAPIVVAPAPQSAPAVNKGPEHDNGKGNGNGKDKGNGKD
jgi:hypothetical protein